MKKRFNLLAIILVLIISLFSGCSFVGGGLGGNSQNIDYTTLVNNITNTSMKSNVWVDFTYSYHSINNSFDNKTSVSSGSGVIIDKKLSGDGYIYYFLTNNHVVQHNLSLDEYVVYTSKNPYEVYDCWGRGSMAQLIHFDKDYDLALLSFSSKEDLPVLKFATKTLTYGDLVISLGQPDGQKNAITFGKYLGMQSVELANNENSSVNFDVLRHNAPITHGSSGGVLLNYQLLIVGINFAGLEDDEISYGFAIPNEKVLEFLIKTGYNE